MTENTVTLDQLIEATNAAADSMLRIYFGTLGDIAYKNLLQVLVELIYKNNYLMVSTTDQAADIWDSINSSTTAHIPLTEFVVNLTQRLFMMVPDFADVIGLMVQGITILDQPDTVISEQQMTQIPNKETTVTVWTNNPWLVPLAILAMGGTSFIQEESDNGPSERGATE